MTIEQTIELAVQRAVAPLHEKLAVIEAAVCYKPDETILADEEVARRLNKSVSTVRRMKRDNRIGYVSTPKGRMVRVCDL